MNDYAMLMRVKTQGKIQGMTLFNQEQNFLPAKLNKPIVETYGLSQEPQFNLLNVSHP